MAGEKIALFDFCGTMINFQSADAYVRYVKSHVRKNARMLFIEGVRKFATVSRIMRVLQKFSREGFINKRMLLTQLKGLSFQEMDELAQKFFREVIRPNYIPGVIEAVKKYKAEGYRLLIVSGGYDIYLKYVAEEFGFDDVISTRLDFDGGTFTGRYKGMDCMNAHKVSLLKEYFGRDSLRDCESVAYSDSRSDIPLMKYCRKGVAVLRNSPPPPSRQLYVKGGWIEENGFEVLAW